jgi:hypothetical protein
MRFATAITLLVLVSASLCFADDFKIPKMALHIEPHAQRSCQKAATLPTITTRGDFDYDWTVGGGEMDVFVYVFQYNRFQGAEFALMWPSDWGSTAFTACADLAIGSIVDPGDGISLAWNTCQSRAVTGKHFYPLGWAWLADPTTSAQIRIWDHPQGGHVNIFVGGCADSVEGDDLFNPDSVFYAAVDSVPYSGPPVYAVKPTTWGSIKAIFE